MRIPFRCLGLGIVFLAMIAAAVSCRKAEEKPAPEKPAESWPVVAVLEWIEAPTAPDVGGSSVVLYSDRRLIVKRPPAEGAESTEPTFWTRVLSKEEFSLVETTSRRALTSPEIRDRNEFGSYLEVGAVTGLYFGVQEKGVVIEIEGVRLLELERDPAADLPKLLDRNYLPEEVRAYWKALLRVTRGDFEPWQPTTIVVQFWRGLQVGNGGVTWPKEWPRPEFRLAKEHEKKDWSFVTLPLDQLQRIEKMFEFPDCYITVEVDGQKCIASFRRGYPGIEIWGAYNAPAQVVEIPTFIVPIDKPKIPMPAMRKNAFEP